jgi:hypothetical protein
MGNVANSYVSLRGIINLKAEIAAGGSQWMGLDYSVLAPRLQTGHFSQPCPGLMTPPPFHFDPVFKYPELRESSL